jgi:hypothetical protein
VEPTALIASGKFVQQADARSFRQTGRQSVRRKAARLAKNSQKQGKNGNFPLRERPQKAKMKAGESEKFRQAAIAAAQLRHKYIKTGIDNEQEQQRWHESDPRNAHLQGRADHPRNPRCSSRLGHDAGTGR